MSFEKPLDEKYQQHLRDVIARANYEQLKQEEPPIEPDDGQLLSLPEPFVKATGEPLLSRMLQSVKKLFPR